jgi:hypothetical protein
VIDHARAKDLITLASAAQRFVDLAALHSIDPLSLVVCAAGMGVARCGHFLGSSERGRRAEPNR